MIDSGFRQINGLPFALAVDLVTNEEYELFCQVTGRKNESTPGGRPLQPVTGITWHEATAFAKWCGCRLPTEDELKAAERWPDDASWEAWPLSERPDIGDHRLPASVDGINDLIGVIWQWTSTEEDSRRVSRGGGWASCPQCARVASRDWDTPSLRLVILGVRLAKDIER